MKPIRHYPLAAAAFGAALLVTTSFGANAADVRKVVRDTNNNVVVNTFENCVRTDWTGTRDACGAADAAAPAPRQYVQTEVNQIALDQRTIYFQFDKSNLTAESRDRLDTLANRLKSDQNVREAKIVGYADRIGSVEYNDRLSQKRANAVNDYLTSRGVINTRVTETRWFGEEYPTTSCGEGLGRTALIACLAKDRRVEVEVDYLPASR